MSIFVIWIDREHAKLFQFSNDKMERKALHAKHPDHHTHVIGQLDLAQWEKTFFTEVANHLESSSQILILGPGIAKHHFQTYLMEHHPLLSKKVVGCEAVDHPTDGQIASLARRFFKLGVSTPS